ncbi:hypothetical protein COU14_03075 [Candidatus Kaiserbacteria bacterium CG10_big_fil_rev_8_21_14_0_10_44_10]|uniref:Uncharacterized protein n=1 Tax=Candidatus Kaiserbacteria bacterium CG10_big_fil_rev_8_21_14_0_10_44_10 TaxID=1974606 RepID=A0A2H0UH04_9BACT|nr:MAG: hypothetical protein COU14_03075 [Candidatus Kaiserbacteria bacterium CG10_big_fil_rev_8_21_14_0_10_44_10]
MTNSIKLTIYGVASIATLSLMVFVVLPQLPQMSGSSDSLSTSAEEASAWAGGSGGEGGCCGGGGDNSGPSGDNGGGSNDSPSPYIPPAPVPAVCNYLTTSQTSLPYGGGTVTLSWSTSNATSASINNGVGQVNINGSVNDVVVTSSITFTLTAVGAGGNASCAVTVTVSPPPPTPAAVCSYFDVSPNTVPYGGGNVTIAWQTSDATSVSINNGVGTVSANGSKTVFVSSDTTFQLTAIGTGGNDTHCVDSVTVNPPPTPAATCDSFTADRYNVPYNGGNVLLSWETTNASSVSIDNGVGNVSADGSKNVYVDSTTTYTLTAVGAGGNDTCTVTITKGAAQAPICDYLRVSDDEVEEGDDVTLSWETTNATSVSIDNGIGNVSADGSKTVEIDDDTTFTLTAVGTNGSDTCTVRVEIEEEEDKKTPRCELDISKDRVKRGEKVTLSWETTNVDEIVIKDDRGNTIFDTDDYSSSKRKKYYDGEIDVIINQSTEFRMKAEGEDGGSRTCKVDVDVDDIAVYEKRDQALVIALTQVPYTGFEAGAFLTFLFYAVLTLWALFIAYILVVKKGSVLGFSLYGATAGMSETDVENRKKVEALVAKYADQSWK